MSDRAKRLKEYELYMNRILMDLKKVGDYLKKELFFN